MIRSFYRQWIRIPFILFCFSYPIIIVPRIVTTQSVSLATNWFIITILCLLIYIWGEFGFRRKKKGGRIEP